MLCLQLREAGAGERAARAACFGSVRWVFVRGVVKGLSLSQPFPRAAACPFHLKMARAFATGVKMGLVPLPVACVVGGSQQGGL